MFNKTYESGEFEFAGKTYKAKFETLPGDVDAVIQDYLNNDQVGICQKAILYGALVELVCDGDYIFKNTNKGSDRVRNTNLGRLPAIREHFDREKKLSVHVYLMREYVIPHEFWIPDMFPGAFDDLVKEEEAVENPTPAPSGTKKKES
jgi:hypothetical protein